jgi:hypothetical protein
MDYEKIIRSFAELAQDCCKWAEGPAGSPGKEHFLATNYIAKLYLAGLELPMTEPEDDLDAPSVSDDEYKKIFKRFGSLPFQYYWEIFDPVVEKPEEPVTGDVCDDLADIYRDLKVGLIYWDKSQQQNAVFHWKTSFGFHWGRHATSALRALHCYEVNDEK